LICYTENKAPIPVPLQNAQTMPFVHHIYTILVDFERRVVMVSKR
jgi:hypothetical protein